MPRPLPRQPVPALKVPTLAGGQWTLSERHPEHFTLVVFYRGLHCPICSGYVKQLDRMVPDFESRGVEPIAISSDVEARARQAADSWRLERAPVGYGLDLDSARAWGLYVSTGRGMTSAGVEEPAQFSEPGLFLVRPDGTLYYAAVQSMPFARPHFDELVKALDFAIAKDYPARGEAA